MLHIHVRIYIIVVERRQACKCMSSTRAYIHACPAYYASILLSTVRQSLHRKLLGNSMYKKTYYEKCISAHMPNLFIIPGCKAFGAKWHGTFEASAFVWSLSYSCENFQQIT